MRLSIFPKRERRKKCDGLFLPLGGVGKIDIYGSAGRRYSIENVLIMQIAFVVLIAVLLIVCALEITAYYHRILEPLEKFGQKLEELKEQV